MDGIVLTENMGGGRQDVANKIAKVGFVETPLLSMIPKGMPVDKSQPVMGHQWQYETLEDGDDDNAQGEGTSFPTATSNILGTSKNHYQIITDVYGVSGSAEDVETTEKQKEFTRQGVLKMKKHRKTIEKAMFKAGQAPVERNGATVGKMGSLLHWCGAEVTVDGGLATLTMAKIRDMLKIGWNNGVPMTHIFVNDINKDIIDDLLDAKVRTSPGANVMKFTNYTEMKNLSYAPNVKIILSPYVASSQVVGVNLSHLALVYKRLMKTEDVARTKDAKEKTIITEATLRVNNPYAVSLIDNLA